MISREERDTKWMQKALEEAVLAQQNGELPIAAILVAGDAEIARAQTQTGRRKSMTGHAELWALIEAQRKVYTDDRPLTIFTTLEPCLMCLGAAIQCGVDEVVFAMAAPPDGGSQLVSVIANAGQKAPVVRQGVLKNAALEQMRDFVTNSPNHPGIRYAKLLLNQ